MDRVFWYFGILLSYFLLKYYIHLCNYYKNAQRLHNLDLFILQQSVYQQIKETQIYVSEVKLYNRN